MSDGPYLFDVGVLALAHSDAPVRDTPLSYVKQAIAGEIDAVVPYASVVGAHNALTTYYGLSNARASRLMENFLDASEVHWYDGMSEQLLRDAFDLAREQNVGGWDGYYGQVALSEGVETVLTIDDDFEGLDGVEAEVVLTSEEFGELNEYLGY
jgi:predicted nucleic acid-binding protein